MDSRRRLALHVLLAQLLVVIAWLTSIGTAFAKHAGEDSEAARIIRSLEKTDREYLRPKEHLFVDEQEYVLDPHGDGRGKLLRLMILRFDATAAVQAGIDRNEHNPRRKVLVASLYRVLGFVKDPATIPWLEAKLRSPHRQFVYDNYMWKWERNIGIGEGFGNDEGFGGWRWLTGSQRWITFFIDVFDRERSTDRRIELMNVLKGFDGPLAMQFFSEHRLTATNPGEVLLIEAYRAQHDLPVDDERIAKAIRSLSSDPDYRDLLLGTADAIRSKAFIPYLVDTYHVALKNITPAIYESKEVLQDITFVYDIDDPKGWLTWYGKHRNESRDLWMRTALDAFRDRLKRDPSGARKMFEDDQLAYRWNDIRTLPFIHDVLLPRAEYRSEVAGWINLTYSPFYRPRLKPIADELARHPESLEWWARGELADHDFIPGAKPETWEECVVKSNRPG